MEQENLIIESESKRLEFKESLSLKEEIPKDNENSKKLTHCPYCQGKLIKRGKRKKKFEEVQRYYCSKCDKSLISAVTKNKTYPLRIIIDSLTLYNRLYSLEEISNIIYERYGIKISSRIVLIWVKEYEKYIPFLRMREFISQKYSKKEIIEESKLIHQQIYNFKYHRAKTNLILNEKFNHFKFKPLQEFLGLVVAECPHQLFQNPSKRASEFKDIFNLEQVKIISKENSAIKTANFVMQTISNNKLRHEILQNFMLSNDSVTVAVEVPVLISNEDILHYKYQLDFNVPLTIKEGEYITGHIDLIQIRNGLIHIMDFKPSAKKEKPIAQLTIYALALSRLTGLRLYNFKCAWFDNKNYYEFFPLHVVYKLKKRKRIPRDQKKLSIPLSAQIN